MAAQHDVFSPPEDRSRRRLLAAAALLGVLAALAGIAGLAGARAVPAVELRLIDGRRIALEGLRGRPLLVHFWATTCATCQAEMPQLVELYRTLAPRGLELVAVAMPYDRPDWVLETVRRRRLPYPVALDVDGEVLRAFGDVPGTPTTFLVSPAGRIVAAHSGPTDFDRLRARLAPMLRRSAG